MMTEAQGNRRLLTDGTVGKLTRWLRVLGYDTRYESGDDALVAHRARADDRVLVTRKSALARRVGLRALLITEERPVAQLLEVVRVVGLPPEGTPPRCMVCNMPLEALSQADAADRVPPYVATHHEVFHHCPGCGRIYWQGTHWTHMRRRLSGVVTLTNPPDLI